MALSSLEFPRDLGHGLILRRSTPADADPLADFNKMIFREPPATEPDEFVAAWTRELLNGGHPTFNTGDFTIVAEAASGRIVSSLCLISQTWTYDGIPFGVGRPELVGTEPEYRKRGLVRAQFEVMHALSAARGELVQAITGIPFYYRQFGYEMALDLGGGRQGSAANVPKLKDGDVEPFRLRTRSRLICALSWSWTRMRHARTWSTARGMRRCGATSCGASARKTATGSTGSSSRPRLAKPWACWAVRLPCGARGWGSTISN